MALERARGDVVEVWQDGRKVGVLFDWRIHGTATEWSGEARKQSFVADFRGGEVEVRFLLTASSDHIFQIRGRCEITGFTPGARSRTPVQLKGTRLWTVTTSAVPTA